MIHDHLAHVLAIHFDPANGTPYWLERQRQLGFCVRKRVKSMEDLNALGPFDENALRCYPIRYFMPRRLDGVQTIVTGETGGATGIPKTAAYSQQDFHAAFIEPFLKCVESKVTFDDGYWLWIGPGGPHIIGKAAQAIARITTNCDAFSVDFDPRWFRRLAAGSMARERYLQHLIEQALQIVRQQRIRYLFSTPVVLVQLAERLSDREREMIRFAYLGGMSVETGVLRALSVAFPGADFLSGYGNTLFGVSHELEPGRPGQGSCQYYPCSSRLAIRVVSDAPDLNPAERLFRDVAYGESGQVVMYRLDESGLFPGVMERDRGVRLAPPAGSTAGDGVGNPNPLTGKTFKVDNGIY